jgi:hypothetical protein
MGYNRDMAGMFHGDIGCVGEFIVDRWNSTINNRD